MSELLRRQPAGAWVAAISTLVETGVAPTLQQPRLLARHQGREAVATHTVPQPLRAGIQGVEQDEGGGAEEIGGGWQAEAAGAHGAPEQEATHEEGMLDLLRDLDQGDPEEGDLLMGIFQGFGQADGVDWLAPLDEEAWTGW